MSGGISVNFGSLNISTPPIVMPTVSPTIGNMAQQVTQYMQNSESGFGINTAPAYDAINKLLQNNYNFQAMQNATAQSFNATAANVAQYQANAISNQGKK